MNVWSYQLSTEDVSVKITGPELTVTSSDMLKPGNEVNGNISIEALAGIVVGSIVGLLLISVAFILVACRLRRIIFVQSLIGRGTTQLGTEFNSQASERSVESVLSVKLSGTNTCLPASVPVIKVDHIVEKGSSDVYVPAEACVKLPSDPSGDVRFGGEKPQSRDGWYRLRDRSPDSRSLNGLDNPVFHLQVNDEVELARATSSSSTHGSPGGHQPLWAFAELSPGGRSSPETEWSPGCRASPSGTIVKWSPEDQRQAFHSVVGSVVRRSYRLDGVSALAIAAERNRDSSVFYDVPDGQPDGAYESGDIIVIYNERTAL